MTVIAVVDCNLGRRMARQSPLERARDSARLGLPPAPNSRFRLLRRVIVRLNWFTLRHQIDHNIAMLRAVDELRAELHAHQLRMSEVVASMEASLRSEILGSETREDRHEREIISLVAATAAMQARLDEINATTKPAEGSRSAPESGTATVATLRAVQTDHGS